jgi:asparagine synthase (glutamine-hydrolysing)
MCGIAGWVGGLPDAEHHASRLAAALHHRGPDGSDTRLWDDAGLVHTRLSIIDLSSAGRQPMSNEDGSVWLVFNGEIYNHRELRHWLERRGHVFASRCDAEVIPHLYEEDGPAFLERLRGMFALAVLDVRRRRLLLARDRFGIKPLFYGSSAGDPSSRLMFASELPALLQLPDIDRTPDPQAISDFAALAFIPAPQTAYRGVSALCPGEVLDVSWAGGTLHNSLSRFHRFAIAPNLDLDAVKAEATADELVRQAVARQIESDVPLGALLSGGIDSSLVSAAAQQALGTGLQTFNVRFPEAAYDETWAAVAVSEHIGSRHSVLDMDDAAGTWEHVTELLSGIGQPFADSSLFAVHAVSRLMRRHVKVALSGDGGDEGFGGYDLFWQTAQVARLARLPRWAFLAAAGALGSLARRKMVRSTLPVAVREMAASDDAGIVEYFGTWLTSSEHAALCPNRELLPVRRHFERQWVHDFDRRVARVERVSALATEVSTRLVMANDYLPKVDAASMRESLEVRVPMLDEDLFEFGLTLPHRLKVQGRQAKVVLRSVARRRLPERVASKPKHGFGVAVDAWVDQEFKTRLRDTLLGPSSRLPDFFAEDAYRPVVSAFCDGHLVPGLSRLTLYYRVVMLLALHTALAPVGNGSQRT